MKKLIILVWWMGVSCPLSAQKVLEGEFDGLMPASQLWDGNYLIFRNLGQTMVYEEFNEETRILSTAYLQDLKYKRGLYFSKEDDGKFQLKKLGEADPVLNQKFDYIDAWFGNVILAWHETGVKEGFVLSWISDQGKIIIQHRLDSIAKALGIGDIEKYGGVKHFQGRLRVIPSVYTEGLIALRNPESQRWGYFDSLLLPVTEQLYKHAEPFFEGMAAVMNAQGFWGFIDSSGEQVIPFQYRFKPSRFSDGLAQVKDKNYKIGFIDTKGTLVIQPLYNEASLFYKGYSLVKKYNQANTWLLLDKKGVEKDSPGLENTPLKSGYDYPDKYGYFPYRTLIDLMDLNRGIFIHGKSSRIYSLDGDLEYVNEHAIIKNLIGGKFLCIERSPMGKSYIPRYGLLNLQGEWLVEVKQSGF